MPGQEGGPHPQPQPIDREGLRDRLDPSGHADHRAEDPRYDHQAVQEDDRDHEGDGAADQAPDHCADRNGAHQAQRAPAEGRQPSQRLGGDQASQGEGSHGQADEEAQHVGDALVEGLADDVSGDPPRDGFHPDERAVLLLREDLAGDPGEPAYHEAETEQPREGVSHARQGEAAVGLLARGQEEDDDEHDGDRHQAHHRAAGHGVAQVDQALAHAAAQHADGGCHAGIRIHARLPSPAASSMASVFLCTSVAVPPSACRTRPM